MATQQKKVTNPIIQRIMADGVFGAGMPQQNLSTESKLNMAQQGTFAALRGGMGAQTNFGQQNEMASAGVYAPGSFGAQNAVANGTGVAGTPQQYEAAKAGFGGPNVTTVSPEISAGAINSALDPFRGGLSQGGTPGVPQMGAFGLAPGNNRMGAFGVGGGSNPSPGFGSGGVFSAGLSQGAAFAPAPGTGAALGVDTMRTMADEDRQRRLFIDPYIPTPGMAPEMAASRFGYLDKLALQSAGIAPSGQQNPVFRGTSPSGTPTLTNQAPNGGTSLGKPTGTAPNATAYDQNRQGVAGLAQQGRASIQNNAITQQMQAGLLKGLPPGYMIDPSNPNAIKPIPGGPAEIKLAEDAKASAEADRAIQEAGRQAVEKAQIVTKTINKILPQLNSMTTGVAAALTEAIPGTPAYNVGKLKDTVVANIGLKELKSMKEASKTGASGMGALSEKELAVLETSLGNLKLAQDTKQVSQAMRDVRDSFYRWRATYNAGQMPDSPEARQRQAAVVWALDPKNRNKPQAEQILAMDDN